MCIKWNECTVRGRMVGKSAIGQATVFGVLILTSALYVGLSIRDYSTETQNEILTTMVTSITAIMADLTRRLQQTILRFERAVLIRSVVDSDALRPDYPWMDDPASIYYMDDPSLLPASIATHSPDYRNGQLAITFARGSYHVKNRTPASIPSFPAALNSRIIRLFTMNSVSRRLFSIAGGSIASIYSGHLSPEHSFDEFPGVADTNITGYDFVTDPLTLTALVSPDAPVYSDGAYRDPYVNKLLISIYKAYRNISDWSIIAGIAGADILLTELADILFTGSNFQNVSRAAIYQSVNENVLLVVDSNLQLYLDEPLISDGDFLFTMFAGAKSTDGVFVVEDDLFIYLANQMELNGYVVVIRVPKQYVDDQMAPIRANEKNAGQVITISMVVTLIGTFILTASCLAYCMHHISATLIPLTLATEEIPVKHLGAATTLGTVRKIPVPPNLPDLVTEEQNLLLAVQDITVLVNESRVLKQHPLNDLYYKAGATPQLVMPPSLVHPLNDLYYKAGAMPQLVMPPSLVPDEKDTGYVARAKRNLLAAQRAMENAVNNAQRGGDDEALKRALVQQSMNTPSILVMQAHILKHYDRLPLAEQYICKFILTYYERLDSSVKESCVASLRSLDANASPRGLDYKSSEVGGKARFIIGLDNSGSMADDDKMRRAIEGLIGLIGNPKLVPADSELAIYSFSDYVLPVITRQDQAPGGVTIGPINGPVHASTVKAIQGIQADNATALYNMLHVAYNELDRWGEGPRDYIIIITDGINGVRKESKMNCTANELIQRPKQPKARVAIMTVGDILSMPGGKVAFNELTAIATIHVHC